ncbi:LysR substrate-binding domain-containing protein [Methylobacterium sp. E-046]|uniref:LysR substrate-binding domain-containing protein n=1 Tax=Methylobacterium sp. E-046 TaxID=2836576 RepID=UPI001FB94FC0|nr:LysR substrate-binding domain-containing protein [Methylobacterium sp. E-046]MCJ2097311.1 LysR substrate-binding domain-containing protein [Methylobacterium sp. E-046]
MDISQLRTLAHIAELGSVSKAADRLNIAQPALSRQIRLLEQELGAYLFERHGRGMVITDVGREVLAHAVRIMAEMDAIRDTVAAGQTSFRGSLSIGTTPTVAEIVTVPLATRLRQDHPNLSLRLSSAYSGHILDWLQRGQIDVAVSYNPNRSHTVRIVPIMLESLLLITAGQRRLGETVPFSRLAEEELVLPSPGHMLRDIVDDCARRAGIRIHTVIEADSFQTLINLVRTGIGATVLPLAPIYTMVEAGDLSASRLTDPAPTRELVVAYAADRPVSLAARFVGQTIVEIAMDLARRGIWVGQVLEPEKDLKEQARSEPSP